VANELILVVEDNDKNRKLVRDVLTFKGYEIIEAETGKRASVWPKSDPQAWS
jgi:two-component system, cell cycle response regulator DivK